MANTKKLFLRMRCYAEAGGAGNIIEPPAPADVLAMISIIEDQHRALMDWQSLPTIRDQLPAEGFARVWHDTNAVLARVEAAK